MSTTPTDDFVGLTHPPSFTYAPDTLGQILLQFDLVSGFYAVTVDLPGSPYTLWPRDTIGATVLEIEVGGRAIELFVTDQTIMRYDPFDGEDFEGFDVTAIKMLVIDEDGTIEAVTR